jgi:hypothetical protein
MSDNNGYSNPAEQFVNDHIDLADIHRGLNYIHVEFHINEELNDPAVEAQFYITENELGEEEVCPNGIVNTPFGDEEMLASFHLQEKMEDAL